MSSRGGSSSLIYGANPVREAIRAGRATLVHVSDAAGPRTREILEEARRAGIAVERVAPAELDRWAGGGIHQGIAARLVSADRVSVQDLVESHGPALLVVLDGIEDPHNLGAIARSVDASGANGLIRQSRHAAPLGGAAAKASAGALSHIRVAEVVNIARTVEELKAAGVWTIGLAGDADLRYDEVDLTLPSAIVVGAEGTGLRRLVRERCDLLARIPMRGHVDSVNASVAAAVVLFEAVRQRVVKGLVEDPGGGQGGGR